MFCALFQPAFWMVVIFIVGYGAIITEHTLKINKAASALLISVLLWTLLFLTSPNSLEANRLTLVQQLGTTSEVVFFLMAAMTIVEVIILNDGFQIVKHLFRPMPIRLFALTFSLATFFMSAILDNLTTTLVMVVLLRELIHEHQDRLLLGGLVVIAANAGGAWTPIGDVTTTMLWLKGYISSGATISKLFWPSLASLLVAIVGVGLQLNPATNLKFEQSYKQPSWHSLKILVIGLLSFILVPVFKMLTHLPAYMGLLLSLSLLWIMIDRTPSSSIEQKRVTQALKQIDSSILLFFLGILLSIGALEEAHILSALAENLSVQLNSERLLAVLIGMISAVVDNVPLVSASMSMYSLSLYPVDHFFWQWIAFCAGTGGSILIVGSAAGVAFMGLEKVSFNWYARAIGLPALAGFFTGILILML